MQAVVHFNSIIINSYIFLPNHNNQPNTLITGFMAVILSQGKVNFCPHKPFLFSYHITYFCLP